MYMKKMNFSPNDTTSNKKIKVKEKEKNERVYKSI